MGIKQTISHSTLGRLLKLARYNNKVKSEAFSTQVNDDGAGDLSLGRIKDTIVEAYDCADHGRREGMLKEAVRMERQLVEAYRSKGLEVTAHNITANLSLFRKRQRRRS